MVKNYQNTFFSTDNCQPKSPPHPYMNYCHDKENRKKLVKVPPSTCTELVENKICLLFRYSIYFSFKLSGWYFFALLLSFVCI